MKVIFLAKIEKNGGQLVATHGFDNQSWVVLG